ncbi:hypothetical protein OROHE_014441 [Orobanche hederae]
MYDIIAYYDRRAGLSVYDFVSRYFKQEGLVKTSKEHIYPIPHPGEWNIPLEISSIVCLTPYEVRQADRPRMSRVRFVVENLAAGRRPHECGRCKGIGHNKKSCKRFIPIGGVDLNIPPEETQEMEEQTRQRRRQKKRYNICRNDDHDIRGCPYHEP